MLISTFSFPNGDVVKPVKIETPILQPTVVEEKPDKKFANFFKNLIIYQISSLFRDVCDSIEHNSEDHKHREKCSICQSKVMLEINSFIFIVIFNEWLETLTNF